MIGQGITVKRAEKSFIDKEKEMNRKKAGWSMLLCLLQLLIIVPILFIAWPEFFFAKLPFPINVAGIVAFVTLAFFDDWLVRKYWESKIRKMAREEIKKQLECKTET